MRVFGMITLIAEITYWISEEELTNKNVTACSSNSANYIGHASAWEDFRCSEAARKGLLQGDNSSISAGDACPNKLAMDHLNLYPGGIWLAMVSCLMMSAWPFTRQGHYITKQACATTDAL